MIGINDKYDDKLKELEDKLNSGDITTHEYNELKSFDIDYDQERESTELFKELYKDRKPIKCSLVLLDIYDSYKSGFRKAILLRECLPDPLGFRYNQEIHKFSILIIKRAYRKAESKGYPDELLLELKQLYWGLTFFNHNNLKNTEKLNECRFIKFKLSEQLRMICIFLEEQKRLSDKERNKAVKKQGYFTGMESAVSNKSPENNPNMLLSVEDNFEGLLEAYDTLVRFLYFKKSEEYKSSSIPENDDISHIEIPSFEVITHLSVQRNILVNSWEKYKYSGWVINLKKHNDEDIYELKPKREEEYRQHIIAINRRKYSLMIDVFKNVNNESIQVSLDVMKRISDKVNKDNICSLFSVDKSDYFKGIKNKKMLLEVYKNHMHPLYKELTVNDIKVEDIFKNCELLLFFADCYKQSIEDDFYQENPKSYKYLAPIIHIDYFTKALSNYYGYSEEYSIKLIECFIFRPGVKSESDIFARPLLAINDKNVIFTPMIVEQMNIDRIIELLIYSYNVNIARIGTDFENQIQKMLKYLSVIKVNTSKIDFFASDGKDVEFDFIGTFEDYLLLWEFKAMTTPYTDKKIANCKKVILEGVEQVNRRSKLLKSDWSKIRKLANIDLPEKPYENNRIIRLVCTNIYDFTTLLYDSNIRVVDESTLLKFFITPEVKVVNVTERKSTVVKKLWGGKEPTVDEFLKYLEDPITISPYKDCINSSPNLFRKFEEELPLVVIDQILSKNPYELKIKETLQQKFKHRSKKIGRNEPCPCGSGKKYKRCCGR